MRKAVYNDRYYKVQAMLKSPDFQADIKWLKDQFKKYNIPIPEEGFRSEKDYMAWNEKFWDVFAKCESSQAVKELWNSLAEADGKIHGTKNIHIFEERKAEIVPPVYGDYLRRVAWKYGFEFSDTKIKDFLIGHVFFNKTEPTEQPFLVTFRRNEKSREIEMYIRIYPWTTKEDIVREWGFINEQQKDLPDFIDRNHKWKNFDRDYEIYELYEVARQKRIEGDKRALDLITYSLYRSKYPDIDIDLDNIKRINSRVRKRLGLRDTVSDDTV